MKVGIFGIGAIGSVIATALNTQHDHYYFNRSEKERIVVSYKGKVWKKSIVLHEVHTHYRLDWLIICLKEYHFKGAEKDLAKLIDQGTKIAVIRNGINLKGPILQFTKEDHVLECMVDCPVQQAAEGVYLQLKKPQITVQETGLSKAFEGLFNKGGMTIKQVEDYKTANWEKVIESSALGGILALSGETVWIFKDPEVVAIYRKVVREGILVANQEGAAINDCFEEELISKLRKYPAAKSSSMLMDRINKNPIEINAKNGIISLYGKKHGIKTEVNDMITILLRHTNQKTNQTKKSYEC
jgi:2-dehydropantoate 2-reductase